ncbi:methylated-DNA--[protein]-cysteine S-methyltransferase [Roseateles cellulosilyticus]|uniref:Methylated-DNA--[protein]-cysteine S-methyltransferase n=1 Tax=Pelomonas cellulosilytica TaxID=2906762 RepID=A0ABS8XTL9_9BURK|nr:methylated-DNA--[protein]-cysteine S-methyltransferase [Pelomonas sp. P8]MCE4556054.1 methylated-DNA--[protein]-cysteine S-methyltransferase [Pelomonas sp. P8]
MSPRAPVWFAVFDTALGACGIAWRGDAAQGIAGSQLPAGDVAALRALMQQRFGDAHEAPPPEPVQRAIAAVQRLLAGETPDHRELLDIPLDDRRLPDFDRRVLWLTRTIPVGRTRTYGEIAAALGQPGGARAVGRAAGHNPFPPIVPCHRVMGAGGAPTGFSAPGGLETKRRLLLIEARSAGQLAGDQQALF